MSWECIWEVSSTQQSPQVALDAICLSLRNMPIQDRMPREGGTGDLSIKRVGNGPAGEACLQGSPQGAGADLSDLQLALHFQIWQGWMFDLFPSRSDRLLGRCLSLRVRNVPVSPRLASSASDELETLARR